MERLTIFSPDRLYRYTLWREWERDSLGLQPMHIWERGFQYVMFIGLNPSTADETKDDPTIRRCIAFSKAWGYGAMCMTNLFAWRATDPTQMMRAHFPVGIDNAKHLLDCAKQAGLVVAAWGTDGRYLQQQEFTKRLMEHNGIKLHCLGLNKDRTPKHPLYLRSTLTPIRLPEPAS